MFFAHKTEDGRSQLLADHLKETAEIAEGFAKEEFKPIVYLVGLVHDIGKFAEKFQRRLDGSPEKFEHSICGALEIEKFFGDNAAFVPMLEFCVACHHTGLQDGGSSAQTPKTLSYRLSSKDKYTGDSDYSSYSKEIKIDNIDFSGILEYLMKCKSSKDCIEMYAFFTRYIFSCLVDADFLDTEEFFNQDIDRSLACDFKWADECVNERLDSFSAVTDLQKARKRLQDQAFENAKKKSDISILNMPTGSGKTLCSMKLALNKLLEGKNKKRIIYVAPYTGIIDQTASEFEKLFLDKCQILQHHSNYSPNENNLGETTAKKLRLASENWDAPIIITTAVQFFESIVHYKTTRLRKLHNMADSIIVFDEIHTLPIECIQPCFRAISYLVEFLNSEVIFLSATMPDYSMFFKKYIPNGKINNLICDKSDFKYFKKAEYINLGEQEYETIALKAQEYSSSLIIVNTKKVAKKIYSMLTGKKYHLSTNMTAYDRLKVFKEIKNLPKNEKYTVVSTSLIEAGVDLDFEAVFREIAGLDNILQAAGRCNREGKREKGYVYIFDTSNKYKKDLEVRINTARGVLKEYDDISSDKCVEQYFNTLFKFKEQDVEENTIYKENIHFNELPFKSFAESFNLIEDSSVGIVVDRNSYSNELIEKLKNGDRSVIKELQKYTVPLKYFQSENCEFNRAYKLGIIDDFGTGVYILTNNRYYDEETGLDLEKSADIFY